MWGFKLLGALLLLLSGGYVSLEVGRYERRRLRVLDGYVALIVYIKGQIDCYAMPLNDILARADPLLLADCMGAEGPAPFAFTELAEGEGILQALLAESRPYLDPESERLLTGFVGELGTSFRAQQVARCAYYQEALTEERRKLYEALPARRRICGTLCLCCALGAAVLFW